MAKRGTVIARAKGVERQVQQMLWPGSTFAGGAKRPALEQQDLRGEDRDGRPLWGEVKNYTPETLEAAGGVWRVLEKAYRQCEKAIAAGHYEGEKPRAFAVLWVVGAKRQDRKLAMYEWPVAGLAVTTLAKFARLVVGVPEGDEPCAE